MKVLVIGATGYIGSAVAESLKNAGHETYGLARSEDAAKRLADAGHHVRAGSLEDLVALRDTAHGMDALAYCAAGFEADAGAVTALLPTMKGRPFLYTSGVWVYGDTRGRMLGEIAPLNTPAPLTWRPPLEDRVLEAKGMVFRPGMVFGRKGGTFRSWFESGKQEGVVRVIGDGENHWSNVHVDDLAELYRLAIEEPAGGEVFLACGGMPQLVRKLAQAAASACGPATKVEFVPVEEARKALGWVADCLAMDCKAGSTKPARFFGWSVKHPDVVGELGSGSYLA